jgi:hypothetical protein
MFILGGILLLLAGLMAVASRTPIADMPEPQHSRFMQLDQQIQQEMGMGLKQMLMILSIVILVPAIITIILAITVWMRSTVGIVISMVVIGLTALFLLFEIVAGAIRNGFDPTSIVGIVLFLIPFALTILLLFWLYSCFQATPSRAVQPAVPPGYWQYPPQGQVAAYPQPGYGYQPQQAQQPDVKSQNEEGNTNG